MNMGFAFLLIYISQISTLFYMEPINPEERKWVFFFVLLVLPSFLDVFLIGFPSSVHMILYILSMMILLFPTVYYIDSIHKINPILKRKIGIILGVLVLGATIAVGWYLIPLVLLQPISWFYLHSILTMILPTAAFLYVINRWISKQEINRFLEAAIMFLLLKFLVGQILGQIIAFLL